MPTLSAKAVTACFIAAGLSVAVSCSPSEPAPKSGANRTAKTTAGNSNKGATASGQSGDHIYLLFDGFATCPNFSATQGALTGTNMATILDDLKAELAKSSKNEPKYLISCFGTNPSTIYYSENSYPTFTQFVGMSDFTAKINQIVAKSDNAQVHIVGYSYGGWTAMKVAKEIELKGSAKLATLVTVDPISIVNCTPSDFLGGLSAQAPIGCTSAPSDFGSDGLATIKDKAKVWSNFYQDDQAVLHSGELSGAQNFDLAFSASPAAHVSIITDADLRSRVTTLLTQ